MMIYRVRPKVKIRLLPHGGSRRWFQSSVVCGSKFFLENAGISDDTSSFLTDFLENVDQHQIDIKKWAESRPQLASSWEYCYNRTTRSEKSSKNGTIALQLMDNSCLSSLPVAAKPPISSFQEILQLSQASLPLVGSLVEFVDPCTSKTSFGVVLRPLQAKFNENYNKLIVLDVHNELLQVAPTSVHYHFYGVLEENRVNSLQILENRFNDQFSNRLLMVNTLNSFVAKACEMSDTLRPQFSIIHSQKCQPFSITSISVIEVIEAIKFPESMLDDINQSYWNQCLLLASIHLTILKLPGWILLSNSATNILQDNCSNELPKSCTYFINSSSNYQAINRLISDFNNTNLLSRSNEFMNRLLSRQMSSSQLSYEELNNYFNIWEGRHYKHIIDVIKFALIYPHRDIMNCLQKLDVFKHNENLLTNELYELLENLKIYNNKKCPSTDIYLSANIAGEPVLAQLAASSYKDLLPNFSSSFLQSSKLIDKFQHLRKSKQYYNDHIIYGLPYSLNDTNNVLSFLAISLEKVSARRYTINLHFPDIMAKLSPSSDLFHAIITNNFKSISKLVNNGSLNNLFENKFLKEVGFETQQNESPNQDWIKVGDISLGQPREEFSSKTCLTLSFTYDIYESNPFSKLSDKVKFSFDSIASVKVKNINWKDLEDCLAGKSETSPFRLFRSYQPPSENPPALSDKDCHNISFIYNVMKSHFKTRNAEGASLLEQEMETSNSSNLVSETTFTNENTEAEKAITKISSAITLNSYPKSRFLLNELDKFAGNSTSLYCSKNDIPVFHHNQNLLSYESTDSVLVNHNNMLLPSYHANSYQQTLISRDREGYVSLAGSVIGKSYLSLPKVEVYGNINVREGMNNGYVNMVDTTSNCESLINQLQILNYVQLLSHNEFCMKNPDHLQVVQRFSYLKRYGYNLNGPMDAESINKQITNLVNSENVSAFIGNGHKRYWTLKMVEQRLLQDKFKSIQEATTTHDCVITDVGYKLEHLPFQLSTGYCQGLDLEILILTDMDTKLTIGTTVSCDRIVYLNPVKGECILQQAYTL